MYLYIFGWVIYCCIGILAVILYSALCKSQYVSDPIKNGEGFGLALLWPITLFFIVYVLLKDNMDKAASILMKYFRSK